VVATAEPARVGWHTLSPDLGCWAWVAYAGMLLEGYGQMGSPVGPRYIRAFISKWILLHLTLKFSA
jgi:hypothetical protein